MRSNSAFIFLAFMLAGCHTTLVNQSVVDRVDGNDPENQLEFWHSLAAQDLTSNDDAFHGLRLYFEGKDDAIDYTARVQALKALGMLPADFNRPAHQALDRGTLAFALTKRLDFKGGLSMRLLGVTPRWAIKELEFRGLLPPSSPNQALTGGEFFGIIGKVQDYLTSDPADYPPDVLPGEIHRTNPIATAQAKSQSTTDQPDSDWLGTFSSDQFTLAEPLFASMVSQSTGPSSAPTTETAVDVFSATVIKIEGLVRVRLKSTEPWQRVQVKQVLPQNAIIQTGPAGAVELSIPPDQILTFDRASEGTILDAYKSGGKVTTNIGLKYGRTRYGISAAGVEHESTIRSSSSTLAVRGTIVSVFDQAPFLPEAVSLTGQAQYSFFKREEVSLGQKNGKKAKITGDSGSAAETALAAAIVDPFLSSARSEAEAPLIASVISRGGVITFDQEAGIRVVRGGGAPNNAQLLQSLPGQLNFVVRWDTNANVNLALLTPNGDFLYPIGAFAQGKGGGVVPFDHRGGNGGGFEIVYFPTGKIVEGQYALSATNLSTQTTNLTLEAYFNNRRVLLPPDPNDPFTPRFARREPNVAKNFGATEFIDIDPSDPNLEPPQAGSSRKSTKAHSASTVAPAVALPAKKK